MSLFLVTAPTVEPVSLQEAKLHLRVDADVTDEDALIAPLIEPARDYAETFTHRAFLTQTWDDKYDSFPCDGGPIWIPKAPTISVTSITYIAQDGTSATWSSALYTTDLPVGPKARRGCIVPAYGQSYPSTRDVPNAVVVRFVAGYGATATTVPEMVKVCIKEHVRANHGRGVEDRKEILQWIDRNLWAYKSF